MMELVEHAFSGVNLLYTILLMMVLVYWLIVILGLIDLDAFDLDLDADVDGGLDAHEGGFSWLAYFNVGEAPIMFFVSIVTLVMWVVSMQVNTLARLGRYPDAGGEPRMAGGRDRSAEPGVCTLRRQVPHASGPQVAGQGGQTAEPDRQNVPGDKPRGHRRERTLRAPQTRTQSDTRSPDAAWRSSPQGRPGRDRRDDR